MEMERKDGNALTLKRAADAQEQGESSAKRPKCCIEEKAFCCDVCFEPLRPPIFECLEGHFFCSSCRDKLREPEGKKCTLGSRCGGGSLGMEHAVQSILVDCDYAEHGCTEKNTYYGIGQHSFVCPAQTYSSAGCRLNCASWDQAGTFSTARTTGSSSL